MSAPHYAEIVEHLDVVERFTATHFPGATIAVVGGSTSQGTRTATSDIDLLLIGDAIFADDPERTAMAATRAFGGEVFEVFAYTPTGFEEWAARDLARYRPVIVRMLVEGVPVRDDGRFAGLQSRWGEALDRGPSVSSEELTFRRYVISDLLDDLRDAVDPVEARVVAGVLYERTAELMLLANGHWIAAGKWLPRRLAAFDAARAEALAVPLLTGDLSLLAAQVARELDTAGGRVQDGFVR